MVHKNAAVLALACWATCAAPASADVAVAWNDERAQRGVVQRMSSLPPWQFETPPIEVGGNVRLRFAHGVLYAVSRAEATISAIDPESWTVTRTYEIGRTNLPDDIALVSAGLAYITRPAATHLLRLDLSTGETADVVDLSVFADGDGVPDLGTLAQVEGRLFVQVRRLAGGADPVGPALLAVVDATSGEVVDVDRGAPGLQAIELSGTYPKMKMQALPASRRLFVSATGVFHDEGGLEVIDIDALASLGVFIPELSPRTGPEIGAFAMTRRRSGYVVFSTDFLTSSHLQGFSLSGGVDAPPDLVTTLDYFVPAIVHDPRSDVLFFPVRGEQSGRGHGVHVLDAGTGARLTTEPVGTGAPPTDLELLCADAEACSTRESDSFLRADANASSGLDISDSLYTLAHLFSGRPAPPCRASADANDDGKLDIADPIFLFHHLFGRGSPPPAPFPACGDDPAPGNLDCRNYDAC
jgi:hypothetical protein